MDGNCTYFYTRRAILSRKLLNSARK